MPPAWTVAGRHQRGDVDDPVLEQVAEALGMPLQQLGREVGLDRLRQQQYAEVR